MPKIFPQKNPRKILKENFSHNLQFRGLTQGFLIFLQNSRNRWNFTLKKKTFSSKSRHNFFHGDKSLLLDLSIFIMIRWFWRSELEKYVLQTEKIFCEKNLWNDENSEKKIFIEIFCSKIENKIMKKTFRKIVRSDRCFENLAESDIIGTLGSLDWLQKRKKFLGI